MASDTNPATRRIMNRLGGEARLPLFNIKEGNAGVIIGFPIGGLLAGTVSGIDAAVFPLALIGLTLGVAAVYAAPSHLTAWAWLTDLYRHYCTRPRVTLDHPPDSDHDTTTGGLVQYTPFAPDERTRELTNIRRAWPEANAIERPDGTMVAFLELAPANMDFAMSGDWLALQEAATEFANTELAFPLTLHVTTRSFPMERLIAQLDERLDDADVQANPTFQRLIEEYRDQRPVDHADTQRLHYYLGVEVGQLEVYNRHEQEPTPGEKLTQFPIIGFLFNPFVTRGEHLDEDELRAAMIEKLDDRIETVRTEFVESIAGWSGTRLSTVELLVLGMDFWRGEEHDPEMVEGLMREQTAVQRDSREASES